MRHRGINQKTAGVSGSLPRPVSQSERKFRPTRLDGGAKRNSAHPPLSLADNHLRDHLNGDRNQPMRCPRSKRAIRLDRSKTRFRCISVRQAPDRRSFHCFARAELQCSALETAAVRLRDTKVCFVRILLKKSVDLMIQS